MASIEEKPRVLVIDDLSDARKLLADLYQHAGAEVVSVSSGKEGIEAIKSSQMLNRPFHLVSTDIRMPELNGVDASKEIRDAGFRGSIVAFTATVSMADRQKGQKNGINRYFSKTSINKDIIGAIVDQIKRGESL